MLPFAKPTIIFYLGSETITWYERTADPYSYLIYVNDFGLDALGFDGSEARITFYGSDSVVKMEVEDGNNEDRWLYSIFKIYSVQSVRAQHRLMSLRH